MKTIKLLISKQNIIYVIIAFVFAYIHLPRYFVGYFPPLTPSPEPWWGLDFSWLLTLNYANLKDYIWGSDFIFTYGPLAHLSTRIGWGHDWQSLFAFDLFFFFNLIFISYTALKNNKNIWLVLLLFIVHLLIIPVHLGPLVAHFLLCFLVFWVLKNIQKPTWWNMVIQIVLLSLMFFIKFNTGLVAFPVFMIGLIYKGYEKKSSWLHVFGWLIAPLILIYLLSIHWNVNLKQYVVTAMEIIKGYNDIMYLNHSLQTKLVALFMILAILCIQLFPLIKTKTFSEKIKGLIPILIIFVPLFVVYKSGFVRGLESDFFIISIFIIILIVSCYSPKNIWSVTLYVVLIGISFYQIGLSENNKMPIEIASKLNKLYFASLKDFTPTYGLAIHPNNNQLPEKVKRLIGNKTVDIYPWNSQLLFENKLNFLPRPIFQSYTAYTKYLEEINFENYNNLNKRPEFVIYEFLSIDQRYPLYDESKVNLSLTKNYQLVDTFNFQERDFLVLQKKKDFKLITFEPSKDYYIKWGEDLVFKENTYYEIKVKHNLIGKLISVFEHAPEIKILITGNTSYEYRIGKNLLESGIFLDRKINSTTDYAKLFIGDQMNELEKIKSVKLVNHMNEAFKSEIKVIEYNIITK